MEAVKNERSSLRVRANLFAALNLTTAITCLKFLRTKCVYNASSSLSLHEFTAAANVFRARTLRP